MKALSNTFDFSEFHIILMNIDKMALFQKIAMSIYRILAGSWHKRGFRNLCAFLYKIDDGLIN
jgi:hypothetical protein